MKKSNRAARAVHFLVRCVDVVCQTTTWNFHIWGSDDNGSSQQQIFHSLPLHENHSYQLSKRKCSSPIWYNVINRIYNRNNRRRRKRERHLKMWLRVSAIIFQLFKVIMLEKCVLTILELNRNQRLGHKTKLNVCHHTLTLSTQLQNRSFHVVERTRTSKKCQKMKSARAKRAKILFLLSNVQICGVFVAVVFVVA